MRLNYEGSISIDEAWLSLAEIREYEQVDVLQVMVIDSLLMQLKRRRHEMGRQMD